MNHYDLTTVLRQVWRVRSQLSQLSGATKNRALEAMATALQERADSILEANTVDLENVRGQKQPQWMLEGMKLTPERLKLAALQLSALAGLPDPVGTLDGHWNYDSGASLACYRVPLGTLGLVYEVYPEIQMGGIGMALKSGNGLAVAGSPPLAATQAAIASLLSVAAYEAGIPEGAIQTIPADRSENLQALLRQQHFVDALLVCGRSSWVERMQEESAVPTIAAQFGQGYVYIAASASWEQVQSTLVEGCFGAGSQSGDRHQPFQRPMLGILMHEAWAERYLEKFLVALENYLLVADARSRALIPELPPLPAGDELPSDRHLLPLRIVANLPEATDWLDKHSYGQLEAIVTDSAGDIEQFSRSVEASILYVNSYPNLGDPTNSQLGAFLGIATSKLPARGPISLKSLTTVKYISWDKAQSGF
ncbi:aldehyde dehydrogenase family protein [Synechococcus sp. PCC 7336]|uniref:aldehyde dehydrogenase family protein n=1 Tax=Synechococcus sp. PCC 7336 TaxID=195250 RepID=UPI000349FBEF|nr:aldehyde dehydrogenase family protein [Synechococcus sp. PCC 7336]